MLSSSRSVILTRSYFATTLTRDLRLYLCPRCKLKESPSLDIPTPTHLPLFGTALSLLLSGGAKKLHEYIDRRHKKLGPVFKERLGNVEAVFIADPEYARTIFAREGKHPVHILPEAWTLYNKMYGCSRGLFFMNAEEWFHNRHLMNALLLKGDLSYIESACAAASQSLIRRLDGVAEIEMESELYRWSLETIVGVLVGADCFVANKSELDSKLEVLSRTVHLIFHTSAKLQFVPAVLAARLRLGAWREFDQAVDEALTHANDLVYDLMQNYSKGGLLSFMTAQKMPASDIIKIVIDLVLAAGDTTAYTMQWILYLLAKHPTIQTNIRTDLKSDVKSTTRNFIKEALRLYPVAPFITRILPEDTPVGPYEIPKNSLAIISLYSLGRDAKIFARPDDLVPERWTNRTTTMLQASLAFAMGSRSCIGRKIAEFQLQAAIEDILRNYNVELVKPEEVDVILKMVAVPSKPIKFKFTKLSIT